MIDKPLILFDMDGTLTLQEKSLHQGVSTYHYPFVSLMQQMKKIALSHGIPLEEIDHINRMNHLWNKTRAYAENHGFDEDRIKVLMSAINEPFKQAVSDEHDMSILMPYSMEALEALQKEGYSLGLVTNASRGDYERLSNNPEFGMFGEYFEFSITRDDCGFVKPNPEPILKILDLFGRTNFVFIGDSDFDSQATKDAGGIFILLNSREYSNEILMEMCPYAVINSLKELDKIIEDLHSKRSSSY